MNGVYPLAQIAVTGDLDGHDHPVGFLKRQSSPAFVDANGSLEGVIFGACMCVCMYVCMCVCVCMHA